MGLQALKDRSEVRAQAKCGRGTSKTEADIEAQLAQYEAQLRQQIAAQNKPANLNSSPPTKSAFRFFVFLAVAAHPRFLRMRTRMNLRALRGLERPLLRPQRLDHIHSRGPRRRHHRRDDCDGDQYNCRQHHG